MLKHMCVPALLAVMVVVPVAHAGPGVRTLGMGEAAIANTDPGDFGRDNPAALGLAADRGFRMNLFDVGFAFGNSAFSLDEYNTYNGATLTEQDKSDILAKFEDGWVFRGEASGYGPVFAFGSGAVSVRGVGAGGGEIPDDVLHLLLEGNAIDEDIDFASAAGGGYAAVDAAFSFGRELNNLVPLPGKTSVGAKVHYLRGVHAADIIRSEGGIVTTPDSLYGSGELDVLTATGGTGYALDLGALHEMGPWTFGARVNGLVGTMTWTEGTELSRFRADARTPDFFDSDDDTELFATSDTTLAADSFTTRLPMRVGAGAVWRVAGFTLAGDLESTVAGRQVGESPMRLSVGAERYVAPVLGLRAGGMLGGLSGPSLTGGMSLKLAWWRLDLDAGTFGTLDPTSPKGLRFAIGSSIAG
jgi:hypothetical protein